MRNEGSHSIMSILHEGSGDIWRRLIPPDKGLQSTWSGSRRNHVESQLLLDHFVLLYSIALGKLE